MKIFKSSTLSYGSSYKGKVVRIYKVNESNSEVKVEDHKDNLMLYHGTSFENSIGILEKGFRNSSKARSWFGVGLYMTESSDVAMKYAKGWEYCSQNSHSCVFLNEVLNSKQMQTFSFTRYWPQKNPKRYPFAKHAHINSPTPTEKDYACDEEGRIYRNTPISISSKNDEFVADASFVKPRFLFVLKAEHRLGDF